MHIKTLLLGIAIGAGATALGYQFLGGDLRDDVADVTEDLGERVQDAGEDLGKRIKESSKKLR